MQTLTIHELSKPSLANIVYMDLNFYVWRDTGLYDNSGEFIHEILGVYEGDLSPDNSDMHWVWCDVDECYTLARK